MSKPYLPKPEQRILSALVANLSAAGFMPAAVYLDGEGSYLMAALDGATAETAADVAPDHILRALTPAEVLQVFEDYCMATPTVHFTNQHATTWGARGVMVVPGNGEDFISDWHCGNAAFNAIVETVAEAAGDGVYA